MLEIKNLHVDIEDKPILKGLNVTFEQGKIYALMGPNGSGKSTLANTIMGNPDYVVTQGDMLYQQESLVDMPVDERAQKGVFLSFQYPAEIPGVTITNFLRTLLKDKMSLLEYKKMLKKNMDLLHMDQAVAQRYLNDGFSGGEKKKAEMLQLLMLNPQLAILDETDSGLDIDALRVVSEGVNHFFTPQKTVVVITHYKRILEYIKPDVILVIKDGVIVQQGDILLLDKLEREGYKWLE
ncbi:MAG: Fe-S cluster assembly ATPase SufC [Candidatus Woesearchaeota archaeon]